MYNSVPLSKFDIFASIIPERKVRPIRSQRSVSAHSSRATHSAESKLKRDVRLLEITPATRFTYLRKDSNIRGKIAMQLFSKSQSLFLKQVFSPLQDFIRPLSGGRSKFLGKGDAGQRVRMKRKEGVPPRVLPQEGCRKQGQKQNESYTEWKTAD